MTAEPSRSGKPPRSADSVAANTGAMPVATRHPHPIDADPHGRKLTLLSLAALGVVYGDIGTSPLYAIKECFTPRVTASRRPRRTSSASSRSSSGRSPWSSPSSTSCSSCAPTTTARAASSRCSRSIAAAGATARPKRRAIDVLAASACSARRCSTATASSRRRSRCSARSRASRSRRRRSTRFVVPITSVVLLGRSSSLPAPRHRRASAASSAR